MLGEFPSVEIQARPYQVSPLLISWDLIRGRVLWWGPEGSLLPAEPTWEPVKVQGLTRCTS